MAGRMKSVARITSMALVSGPPRSDFSTKTISISTSGTFRIDAGTIEPSSRNQLSNSVP